MRIYTRTGDGGLTSLGDGSRVSKAAPRVEAYGEVDELNSLLGLLGGEDLPAETRQELLRAQGCLFALGAALADPSGGRQIPPGRCDPAWLEEWIDGMSAGLSPLGNFVIPGGCRGAALAQMCRTVCRRAERRVAGLQEAKEGTGAILPFLNRLSDALFVLARWLNQRAGVADLPWNAHG
ncbi:MAG: cob(I)yrinic acid a,c-diamide adenosyltransferase [Acidobacteriota bacterium]